VTFSATGLPDGTTATFSPDGVDTGSGATAVTLTISASGAPAGVAGGLVTLLGGIFFVPFFRRRQSLGKVTLVACMLLAAAGGMTGCHHHHSSSGTHTVTVSATSGAVTHSTTVDVTIP
jgi:hypothetical protein